ncbi:CgeB family protein [Cupriavidus agavae]|uniref:Glycosyl transferase family 1 n=1 Tax=Cupriavidus agavae TaxID=1001822 RepID=A0A4Q7RI46_9BURK|nr:glycosyltransferase [Cupriavidus agavae]RZT31850.1 glycosyl transferase family 1 [Cupriavidus agavae]
MARILYLGCSLEGGTSLYRAQALRRLGHAVTIADPFHAVDRQLNNRWLNAAHFRTGYRALQWSMHDWVAHICATLGELDTPDIVWVDSGELLGPDCIRLLRSTGATVVLYNHDDPVGPRDGQRFATLRRAIPEYELCVVVRDENVEELRGLGASQVMRVDRSYDEVMHAPFDDPADIAPEFRSEVAFIGTWMRNESRDRLIADLITRGIPVSVWGARWGMSPFWPMLRPHHRGGNLSGRDYVAAMQGSKVCIGLLSSGNRDLHTTRTMEIPYAGGLLCAQRTRDHQAMFEEGREAVFWSDADECAHWCRTLLDNATQREAIRLAGMQRIRANGAGNQDICARVVEAALQVRSHAAPAREIRTMAPALAEVAAAES